ncbi:DNA repair protein RecN [Nakamurella leprariae]|uniref:DNA repair protein RecN n=1 Tax=Nakamurella leprariae TaxID=2803911 RepID=A0A938YKM5_9ACTN|nr:DNA repair protein RecN [Nakamurella leprariae]MBM9469608.1 DNA repair protein RecN [Nakamurella leprariae]
MLSELRISGLGVIEEAVLDLHPGFTAVTGETGAGKTMVVTALGLIGGARADAARVRAGADRAVVEARFEVGPTDAAIGLVEAAGGRLDDDGSVIAVRTVTADGRSRAHVGGRAAPAATLAELATGLLAVHGQSEAIGLLRPAQQRVVLDRYAGLDTELETYRRVRTEWLAAAAELRDRRANARERAQREQVLRMGLQEIEAVAPQPGEDRDLVDEVRRLQNADTLREAAQTAATAVVGADTLTDTPTAVALVESARRSAAATGDVRLAAVAEQLHGVLAVLGDAGAELAAYLTDLDADPERLEQLLARQAELKTLTRRYAEDVDGVLAWARDAAAELTGLDSSDEAIEALRGRVREAAERVAAQALLLSARRTEAAGRLGTAVTEELTHLAMGRAAVEVRMTRRAGASDTVAGGPHDAGRDGESDGSGSPALQVEGQWVTATADGIDTVEIVMTAHPGAPALPINRGASGGELSRVMLALEVALADVDPVHTLVFDEVDAGVGGRAATEIGRRLAELARTHQVIVVTHLAQVAAFADRHYVVDAAASGLVGRSSVIMAGADLLAETDGAGTDGGDMTGTARELELARMLGGTDSGSALAHAAELVAATRADRAERSRRSTGATGTAGSKEKTRANGAPRRRKTAATR